MVWLSFVVEIGFAVCVCLGCDYLRLVVVYWFCWLLTFVFGVVLGGLFGGWFIADCFVV